LPEFVMITGKREPLDQLSQWLGGSPGAATHQQQRPLAAINASAARRTSASGTAPDAHRLLSA